MFCWALKEFMEEKKISKSSRRRWNEKGAAMVETALLIALVSLIAIPSVNTLGESVYLVFTNTDLSDALNAGGFIGP
jgi:Flp pilus assembly pilin Flp